MKISLNWLKDYIDIKESPGELSEILTNLGLEVEGMEEKESIPGGLKGLVVGEVKECIKHPNADKLSLTKVDIGRSELLQIVCGAPNVDQGQKVIIAPVGTTLYPVDNKEFVIKKGKIRGEVSEGMICAEDEIGVGNDHNGIIVLPMDTIVGALAADYYNVTTDTVYDIGLTPNRSDATSHLGVARDLAAYYTYQTDKVVSIKAPQSVNLDELSKIDDAIEVSVIDRKACPRYSGICLEDLIIKPSPLWIQERLQSVDVRPINNVVDITNYVLHEYGQPLHAFNRSAISNNKISVRKLEEGTTFKTLDEVDRILSSEDLMICDGLDQGMCIGGVFGGIKSGVKDDTTSIFLESAHFEAQGIRKTSTRHNLRTDAAKCFEKGSDPSITVLALARAVKLLEEYAGAKVSSKLIDILDDDIVLKSLTIRRSKVISLIGDSISHHTLMNILNALSMSPKSEDEEHYQVLVPSDKADVVREVDVIEEILRIYGFNAVSIDDRINAAIQVAEVPSMHALRNKLAADVVGKGYHEMMGLSLINTSAADELSGIDTNQLVRVNNTSNIGLNTMRFDMLISVLDAVQYNFNRQQNDLRLFEFGKIYTKKGEEFVEEEKMILVQTGSLDGQSWRGNGEYADFYSLKRLVQEVLLSSGIEKYQVKSLDNDIRFAIGLEYHQGPNILASFGIVSDEYAKLKELKHDVAFGEINLKYLLKAQKKQRIKVMDISKFPEAQRDIALIMDEHVAFNDIEKLIKKTGKSDISKVILFDVYRDDKILGEGKKSYAINMTFVSSTKSLKDKEINKIVDKIVSTAERQYGAKLR